ncbi:Glyoxalase superfamily enzyme, possibly 3-demethylubiquinone-9 3-methyltransferase [Microlunatus sagamiharensis]|uniref:Glyoxalase superfamily enzyme, possibly 3-demethylubiquinone-9 3-methyltransferase n=1 Tax=Microlunatus sagamiharensis TaxID=546874 RepID=A0A1H2LJY3_9ACTN|nr:VOC family protein [Microlunatus sagamiharensis]SDU80891.1 Glyoxalase superfamily enzyme, possibly 3-demethylubiquinone-9 3-methyltransferase [Microlunatus sagamiharensis]
MSAITPCLWFDTQGEEAARYWVSLFPSSSITSVQLWGPENPERQGTPLMVEFVLDGRPFSALNGGPEFTFSEAFSLQVDCADQAEVDRYWDAFVGDGGQESDCGWCKDKYGFSWQVVPRILTELLADPDPGVVSRAMQAMLTMKRLDVATFERVAAGR